MEVVEIAEHHTQHSNRLRSEKALQLLLGADSPKWEGTDRAWERTWRCSSPFPPQKVNERNRVRSGAPMAGWGHDRMGFGADIRQKVRWRSNPQKILEQIGVWGGDQVGSGVTALKDGPVQKNTRLKRYQGALSRKEIKFEKFKILFYF